MKKYFAAVLGCALCVAASTINASPRYGYIAANCMPTATSSDKTFTRWYIKPAAAGSYEILSSTCHESTPHACSRDSDFSTPMQNNRSIYYGKSIVCEDLHEIVRDHCPSTHTHQFTSFCPT